MSDATKTTITRVIPLRGDYSHREAFPESLTMRPPRVRDELAAARTAETAAEIELLLMATLCGVGQYVLEELERVDYSAVQAAFAHFEAGKHIKSKTSGG